MSLSTIPKDVANVILEAVGLVQRHDPRFVGDRVALRDRAATWPAEELVGILREVTADLAEYHAALATARIAQHEAEAAWAAAERQKDAPAYVTPPEVADTFTRTLAPVAQKLVAKYSSPGSAALAARCAQIHAVVAGALQDRLVEAKPKALVALLKQAAAAADERAQAREALAVAERRARSLPPLLSDNKLAEAQQAVEAAEAKFEAVKRTLCDEWGLSSQMTSLA